MNKVLVAVDGSKHSNHAVEYLIDFVREHGPLEVHIANVEPEPIAWQTHGMEGKVIDAHLRVLGHRSLETAEGLLKEASIPFQASIGRGEPASYLVEWARQLGCDCRSSDLI
ncbi:MAG: universal stress protein [Zoogloea sp.]|uniref:universal stress protein n=1 Tax=Zoogloea sp. TaxID=49181 RepID=UPI003F39666F